VLVDLERLSRDEQIELITDLHETGATMSDWAPGARNKEEALLALRAELESSYGSADFDGVIWGRTAVPDSSVPESPYPEVRPMVAQVAHSVR
jgi:hypothetical protein